MSDCTPCGCRDRLPMKELSIEDWKDEYLKLVIYVSEVSRENAKLREQGERLFNKALELGTENAKLRLLVRNLIRATHPADRAELITNAAELGIEVDE